MASFDSEIDPNEIPEEPQGYATSTFYGAQNTLARYPWDPTELNPEFKWPISIRFYDQMRRDGQIATLLHMAKLGIRRAQWEIDPAGANMDFVRALAADLGLPIRGEADGYVANAPVIDFNEHLSYATEVITYGHFACELTVQFTNKIARLKSLSPRLPSTLTRIDTDTQGHLIGIYQSGSGFIPASALVWYKIGGISPAIPQGVSLLRPCYQAWRLKDELQRTANEMIARNGMGIPVAYNAPNATQAEINTTLEQIKNWRAGRFAGLSLPHDTKFEVVGIQGQIPDALPLIQYYDRIIAKIFSASFIELGSTSHGARSLGEVQIEDWYNALQAIADTIAAIQTQHISKRLAEWTYGPGAAFPKIVCTRIGEADSLPPEFFAPLAEAGVITPDITIENHLRSTLGLPELPEGTERKPIVAQLPNEADVLNVKSDKVTASSSETVHLATQAQHDAAEAGVTERNHLASRHKGEVQVAIGAGYPHPTDLAWQVQDENDSQNGNNDISFDDALAVVTAVLAGITVASTVGPLKDAISNIWSAAGSAGAVAANGQLAEDGSRYSQILQGIEEWCTNIDATTRQQLAQTLAEGLANGDHSVELAQAARDVLGDADRAGLIAKTEASRAFIAAKRDTYHANGVTQLAWVHAGTCNDGPCADCADSLDASPIAIDDSFPNGDAPLHPNCDCDISALDATDSGNQDDNSDG